jgi:hypothetical protein
MDDHKLVMISIFFFGFSKHDKDAIFFNENMLGKVLGFGHIHGNKIFFFVFLKGKLI